MLLQDITSIVLPFGGLDVKVNALRGGIQFGEDSLMFFGWKQVANLSSPGGHSVRG
jgi:hypothetical protein